MASSPSLRNKSDLIMACVDSVTVTDDTRAERRAFVAEKRTEELDGISPRSASSQAQPRGFVEQAIRDRAIPMTGTAITRILPPVSPFSAGSRAMAATRMSASPAEADLDDLTETTLPLDELTDPISATPARHLLVVLNCCLGVHGSLRGRAIRWQYAWVADSRAVFVFTRDGDMHVFRDKDEAIGYIEAVDVVDAEYEALYYIDGTVLEAVAVDPQRGIVLIRDTIVTDSDGLRQRIQQYLTWSGSPGSADDLQAVADEFLRWEREHRWPRWPHWLPRLLRRSWSGAKGS